MREIDVFLHSKRVVWFRRKDRDYKRVGKSALRQTGANSR